MNHDRPVVASLCLVLQVESDGQLEVQLDCGTLELAHEGVVDRDVDLGTVECAIPWVLLNMA